MCTARLSIFEMLFDGGFIKRIRFPLDDQDRALGTLTEAGSQPVAQVVCGEPGFTVHNRDGPFGACGDAEATAVACVLIYLDDLSYHLTLHVYSRCWFGSTIRRNNARGNPVCRA